MPEGTDRDPAAEIRSLYVETLARAAYDRTLTFRPPSSPQWDDTDLGMEEVRDHHRGNVAFLVDALAGAGLLPTWSQQMPGKGRYRYVTEWTDPEVSK